MECAVQGLVSLVGGHPTCADFVSTVPVHHRVNWCMIESREYIDGRGRSPFGRWFDGLDASVANRVRMAHARMEAGNLSNVSGVGRGVLEGHMHVGPGQRVYFGRDGTP